MGQTWEFLLWILIAFLISIVNGNEYYMDNNTSMLYGTTYECFNTSYKCTNDTCIPNDASSSLKCSYIHCCCDDTLGDGLVNYLELILYLLIHNIYLKIW